MTPEDINNQHVIISYWDRNYKKFKTIILILSLALLGIIFYNFYRNSRTVFTGTNYAKPPSGFYTSDNIIALKSVTNESGKKILLPDTIPAGYYILSVDGKLPDSYSGIFNIVKDAGRDSAIILIVFKFEYKESITGEAGIKKTTRSVDTSIIINKYFTENSVRDLGEGVFISSTEQNGATQRAGILPGDILLSIKGTPLRLMKNEFGNEFTTESLKFLRSHQPGEVIPFRILRDNKEIIVNVQLATFGIKIDQLFTAIMGLILFSLGLFYILKRPEVFPSRITGTAFIIFGFGIACSFGYNRPDYDVYTFLWGLVINISSTGVIPILYHGLAYFPVEYRSITQHKWKIILPYVVSFITIILFSAWYVIDFRSIDNMIFIILNSINSIYFVLLRVISGRSLNKEHKKIVRSVNIVVYIILGVDFMTTAFALSPYSMFIKLPNITNMVLLLLPMAYIYTTWKYGLFNIDFRIRRSIQYNFITMFWKLFLLSVFTMVLFILSHLNINFPNIKVSGANIEFLAYELDPGLNLIYEKIFIILLSIIILFLLVKFNRKGQNYIDKKFYREKFDYRFAQSKLVRLLGTKLTVESLCELLIEKISDLVHLRVTGIALLKDNNILDDKLYYYDTIKHSKVPFILNEEMLAKIHQLKGAFAVEYLPVDLKNHLLKYKFITLIPIRTMDKTQGILFIGGKLSDTPIRHQDIEFLNSIISNISISLENTFLYEELAKQDRIKHELNLARNIQLASLPQEFPNIPGLDIHAESIPAFEVGGDFFDFLNGSSNDLTVIIGDVSGKGTSSALYMLKIQGILQTLHEFSLSPKELLMRANRLLYKHIVSKSYITAIGAHFQVNDNVLKIARAGHLPLYYYSSPDNRISKIRPDGLGLGLSEENIFNISIQEETVKYSKGDIFLFISDGITDSRNQADEQFGEDRLEELLLHNRCSSSKEICDNIIKKAQEFSGCENQFDDMTIVSVKIE